MHAQTTVASPAGRYYLRGVMETASGFQLNADGTFDFFFSYGALDRSGKGHWSVHNDTVVLNSEPKPAQDFTLATSESGKVGNIVIQIKETNPALLRHFLCRIKGGGKEQEGMTDEKGTVSFTPQKVDTVELLFEFCPEKKSVFSVTNSSHGLFVFTPQPWLMDVFFQNFRLAITKEGLAGGHPLSNETSFRYEKGR